MTIQNTRLKNQPENENALATLSPDVLALTGSRRGPEGWDRRHFMRTAVGAGFAAAVLPVSAQTIHTSSTGLKAGFETITEGGRTVSAYVARPVAGTHFPVMLVVSEVFGVHEHIADMARRFARQGYLAIAPQLFARVGDPASVPSISELMSKIVSKIDDKDVMADLDLCLSWAGKHHGDVRRSGIVGYCWGGRQVWLYAAHRPQIRAGVAFYGKLSGDHNTLQPVYPVDIAASLTVPVLGLYGKKDDSIPVATIAGMQAALESSGNRSHSEFVVYPDAGHGFNADYRPSYVADAATDAWIRTLKWFKQHGAA